MQAKTKVLTDVLDELFYVYVMDKTANLEARMQEAADDYDEKTEVAHKPAPENLYNEPTITLNGQNLKVVDKFTYLGVTLSRAVHTL